MIGWLRRIANAVVGVARGTPEARSILEQGNGVSWLSNVLELFMGRKSSSGVAINEFNALAIAAVGTCARIIGGTVGSLPMHVYRRTDSGGREEAPRHWAYPLLHDSPNEYHTAFTWRELLVTHVLLWGNSYNRIDWLGNGQASALLPLMPWQVEPRLTSRGVKFYQVHLPDGKEDLPDDEVLHIPGLSYDGLQGMSVVAKMRDSMGLAKAAEDLAGSFFANGAKVGGILEVPGRMDPAAQKNLVDSLQQQFAGKEGAFKALVLEEGAKFHGPTMMPFRDAQFLEIRKFQRSEIFGWFGLPPHLGGDTERSTSWGTGIEQQDIGYAKHTITPLCVRIEQELNRKLFSRNSGMYAKFSLDALMRGDFKSRMEGLQIAVGRPWLSVNEAREIEDWNTRGEEYDEIALPLNTGMGAKPPEPDPAPAPAEAETPATTQPDEAAAAWREVAAAIREQKPPVVNVTAGNTHVTAEIPAEIRHQVTHEHQLPDVAKLVEETRTAAQRTENAMQRTAEAVKRSGEGVERGLDRVRKAVRKPRRAVYDKEGNPLGTEIADSLDK